MSKIILFIILVGTPLATYSQNKVFVREYTYEAVEADNKLTAFTNCLYLVKKILLEEIGTYIENTFENTVNEDSKGLTERTFSKTTTIVAGITETKVIAEKWDGKVYYIKAEITLNPDDVNQKITEVLKNKEKEYELTRLKSRMDSAYLEIKTLQEKLTSASSYNQKMIIQKDYLIQSNIMNSLDWFKIAFNAQEKRELEIAISAYKQTILLNPNDKFAYNNLGNVYDNYGDPVQAISMFNKAIEIDSTYGTPYVGLGNINFKKRKLFEAIILFKKAIDIYAKSNIDKSFVSSISAQVFHNLGIAYAKYGDTTKAINAYQQGIMNNPKLGDSYNNLGNLFSSQGENKRAIEIYKYGVTQNPNNAILNYNTGLVLNEIKEYGLSIKYLQKAVEVDENYISAYFQLGIAYFMVKNFNEGILTFDKLLLLNPKHTGALKNRGLIKLVAGDKYGGCVDLKKAVEYGDADSKYLLSKFNCLN